MKTFTFTILLKASTTYAIYEPDLRDCAEEYGIDIPDGPLSPEIAEEIFTAFLNNGGFEQDITTFIEDNFDLDSSELSFNLEA